MVQWTYDEMPLLCWVFDLFAKSETMARWICERIAFFTIAFFGTCARKLCNINYRKNVIKLYLALVVVQMNTFREMACLLSDLPCHRMERAETMSSSSARNIVK